MVRHGLAAGEHPVMAVLAFDAHPGLIAGDAFGLAQPGERRLRSRRESLGPRFIAFISPPSLIFT